MDRSLEVKARRSSVVVPSDETKGRHTPRSRGDERCLLQLDGVYFACRTKRIFHLPRLQMRGGIACLEIIFLASFDLCEWTHNNQTSSANQL
jgi:hypothetical protein